MMLITIKRVHVKEYDSTCMKSLWNCTWRQQKPLDEAGALGQGGREMYISPYTLLYYFSFLKAKYIFT